MKLGALRSGHVRSGGISGSGDAGHVRSLAVGLVTAVVLVSIAVLVPGTLPPVVRDASASGPPRSGRHLA